MFKTNNVVLTEQQHEKMDKYIYLNTVVIFLVFVISHFLIAKYPPEQVYDSISEVRLAKLFNALAYPLLYGGSCSFLLTLFASDKRVKLCALFAPLCIGVIWLLQYKF